MQRSKPPLHVFGRPFYVKVAVASFALGACIELFMIKTGFYDKCAAACVHCTVLAARSPATGRRVTVIEAERVLEAAAGNGPKFGQRAPDPWAPRR
jgi:hypothetical protein